MKYSKFFQFAYLVFAALFLYDVIKQWLNEGTVAYTYLLMAALAIFMFFFRKRFSKKMENKDR